jgi:PAB-dependent poly(A)-specific ribonuclease subunit 3
LTHFGQLVLSLACGTITAIHDVNKAMEHVSKQYTKDLAEVIQFLSSKATSTKSIGQLNSMIAPKLLQQLDLSFSQNDRMEYELSRELENGRLVRLLCKLGFINERPE